MTENKVCLWKKMKLSAQVKRILKYLEFKGVVISEELVKDAVSFDDGLLSEADFNTQINWLMLEKALEEKGIYI